MYNGSRCTTSRDVQVAMYNQSRCTTSRDVRVAMCNESQKGRHGSEARARSPEDAVSGHARAYLRKLADPWCYRPVIV